MKKKMYMESKVYVLNIKLDEKNNGDYFSFSQAVLQKDYDAIMTEAEKRGSVYSLQGFEDAINNEELFLDNSFIYISNK